VDINLPAAEKAAAIIAKRYPNVKAIAIKADVGKESDVKAAVDQAVKTFGRLDIMVLYMSSTLQLYFSHLHLTV
jgi:NAD(P)-dependent dehydrogenase (short-subunit alcohol dehydrogenase family)